jgi:hypothetical protein
MCPEEWDPIHIGCQYYVLVNPIRHIFPPSIKTKTAIAINEEFCYSD